MQAINSPDNFTPPASAATTPLSITSRFSAYFPTSLSLLSPSTTTKVSDHAIGHSTITSTLQDNTSSDLGSPPSSPQPDLIKRSSGSSLSSLDTTSTLSRTSTTHSNSSLNRISMLFSPFSELMSPKLPTAAAPISPSVATTTATTNSESTLSLTPNTRLHEPTNSLLICNLPPKIWERILTYTCSPESFSRFTSTCTALRTYLWPSPLVLASILSSHMGSSSLALLTTLKNPGAPKEEQVLKCLISDLKADVGFFGEAPLRHAIKTGQMDHLRLLLENGADASVDESEPLRHTVRARNGVDLARMLLEAPKGSNPNDGNSEALVEACKVPDLDMVDLLLSYKADANARDGECLKIAVAELKSNKLLDLLLSKGHANPTPALESLCLISGLTPISLLPDRERFEGLDTSTIFRFTSSQLIYLQTHIQPMLKTLLASPTETHLSMLSYTPLSILSVLNDLSLLQSLQTPLEAFSSTDSLALRLACALGHLPLALYLSTLGALWSALEWDSLVQASANGHTHIVSHILTHLHPSDEEMDLLPSFIAAAEFGHPDILELLFTHQEEKDEEGFEREELNDALSKAVLGGHMDCVTFLLDKGADAGAHGKRALRDAKRLGYVEIEGVLEGSLAKRRGRKGRGGGGNRALSGFWGSAKVVSVLREGGVLEEKVDEVEE
ncbi:hypothetical protein HDV05_002345 [Chytridiales sp. JEL 0842]|nr:hypothetical protein HDV05_002345 [Chytridiales sp. JEL 0842]